MLHVSSKLSLTKPLSGEQTGYSRDSCLGGGCTDCSMGKIRRKQTLVEYGESAVGTEIQACQGVENGTALAGLNTNGFC